jgi:hypothetical protein
MALIIFFHVFARLVERCFEAMHGQSASPRAPRVRAAPAKTKSWLGPQRLHTAPLSPLRCPDTRPQLKVSFVGQGQGNAQAAVASAAAPVAWLNRYALGSDEASSQPLRKKRTRFEPNSVALQVILASENSYSRDTQTHRTFCFFIIFISCVGLVFSFFLSPAHVGTP